MDLEFELFFKELKTLQQTGVQGTEKLLNPLKILLLKQQLKSFVVKALIIAAICSAVYYVDSLNWYFCAFGKLAMIKILPFWDWTKLETAKCMIERPEVGKTASSSALEFNWKNCRACQNFGEMNIKFFVQHMIFS